MTKWTHIYLEAYCMFDSHKKLGDKKTKRPNWCTKKFKTNKERYPTFKCLSDKNNKQCPFFGYCNVNKEDGRLFDKAYDKKYKETLK